MERPWRGGYVPGKERVNLYIAEEVARALRIEAAITRQSQSQIVEEALRRELERRQRERETQAGEHSPDASRARDARNN